MKKIQRVCAWLLCTLMLGGLVPVQGVFAATDWQARGEVDLRMGVIADSHINTDEHKARFETALDAFASMDAEYDGLALVGDIVYQNKSAAGANPQDAAAAREYLTEERYDKLLDALSTHAAGKEFIYAMGNHEFPLNGTNELIAQEAKAMFTEKTGQAPRIDKVFNGFHFITAEPIHYGNVMSAENETWMMERIDAAVSEDANKPVFLLLHQAIQGTTIGSSTDRYYSDAFVAYLKGKPQVIVLSAHEHAALQDPRTIWQDGFTVVSQSVLGGGYLWVNEGKVEQEMSSQAMLLEIENNVVSFYRMDLLSGKFIGKPWVLNIPQMVSGNPDAWQYTAARKDEAATPTFPVGAQMTASGLTANSLSVTFPQGTNEEKHDDGFVIAYRIRVLNKKLQQLEQNYYVASDFYKSEQAATMQADLTGLASDTEYLIQVSGVSPFGTESDPLTAEVKTLKQAAQETITEDSREQIVQYVGDCTSTTITRKWADGTGKYGYGLYEKTDSITFSFNVPQSGRYELLITAASNHLSRFLVSVPPYAQSTADLPAGEYNTKGTISAGTYILAAGTNNITVAMAAQAASTIQMWSVALAKEETGIVSVVSAGDYTNSSLTNGHANELSSLGHLVFWGDTTLNFNAVIPADGDYDVYLDSGCSGEGSVWTVTVAGQTVQKAWPDTGAYATHVREKLGTVTLSQGRQSVAAKLKRGGNTSFCRLLFVAENAIAPQEIETSTADAFIATGNAVPGVTGSVSHYGEGWGTAFKKAYVSVAVTPHKSGVYDLGFNFASGGTTARTYINGILLSELAYQGGNPSSKDRVLQNVGTVRMKKGETYIIKIVECGGESTDSLNVERIVMNYKEALSMESGYSFDLFVGDRVSTNLPQDLQYGDGKTQYGYSFGEGTYIELEADIEQAGLYKVDTLIGVSDEISASLYVNGTNAVTGKIPQGDFDTQAVRELGTVLLQSGRQRLRIVNNSGAAQLWGLRLTSVRAATASDPYVVARMANSYDRVSENKQDFTSQSEGVVLGHVNNWVEYDVSVPAGNYKLSIAASTSREKAELLLSLNGAALGSFQIPKNDAYLADYQTISLGVVTLNEGRNTFRLRRGTDWFTYGSIKLEKITEPIAELYQGDYIVAGRQLSAPVQDKMVVRAYLSGELSGKTVSMIAAIYSGTKLCGLAKAEPTEVGANTVVIARVNRVDAAVNGAYTCKIFYLDGANAIRPLCEGTTY